MSIAWPFPDTTYKCVGCGSDMGLPLEVGGHYGVRELPVCRRCELEDYEALVALVDDLTRSPAEHPRKADCPVCGAPTCDCHRPGRAAGAPDPSEEPIRLNVAKEEWA